MFQKASRKILKHIVSSKTTRLTMSDQICCMTKCLKISKEHVYVEYESRTNNTDSVRNGRFTSEIWNKISFVIFVALVLILLGLAGRGVYLLVINVDGK